MSIFVWALLLSQAAPAAAPGNVVVPASRFRLIRSTSGDHGTQDRDRFVFENPRSIFHAGADRQVLVLFEWQGPVGPHHCEGVWKDPSGRAVLTSQSDLVARAPRFGVYWGLTLPDAVATGTWVLEARIDGEPAGAHAFQVVASAPGSEDKPARRVLTVTELYQRGLTLTLTLEALDASGAILTRSSGVLVGPGLVQVTFSSINAARSVRIVTPEARPIETAEVVSWSRRGNWAVLRFPNLSEPPAKAPQPPDVGDRLFLLDAAGDGTRVVIETLAVGRSSQGDLVLGQSAGDAAEGAPILNEYGEVAATVMGSHLLGADVIDGFATRQTALMREGASPGGSRARLLGPSASVSFQLYDDNNQRLMASDPKPLKARPKQTFVQYWSVSSSALKTGIYRVDVVLGPDPVWRGFFRLND